MADWEALRTRLQEEFGLDVDQEDELAVTISRDSAEVLVVFLHDLALAHVPLDLGDSPVASGGRGRETTAR